MYGLYALFHFYLDSARSPTVSLNYDQRCSPQPLAHQRQLALLFERIVAIDQSVDGESSGKKCAMFSSVVFVIFL